MRIKVAGSSAATVSDAIAEIRTKLGDISPGLIISGFNTALSGEEIASALEHAFSCPVLGGSSCKGALCIEGEQGLSKAGVAVLAIEDPGGNYGVGHKTIEDSARAAASAALDMALYSSGRGYESPAIIWCVLPPGQEEDILQGFADVVGESVPIFGGSSADNDVSGQWQQFTEISTGTNQISVAVFYPSDKLGAAFSSGYEPTETQLEVTESCERQLKTLDGATAAVRYNDVTEGAIASQLNGGNVLPLTTLFPLGRRIENGSGVDDYLLSHPDAVNKDGSIALFSRIDQGETLYLMQGSRSSLLSRAKRVVSTAIKLLPEGKEPAGVLMIYCAGCMLTIEDEINVMLSGLQEAFPGLPIFGLYTFGEQGCFLDGHSRHGNLMISAVAFSQ